MGEWNWLIILFWYSQKLMRIYCIEKNLWSLMIYIFLPFLTDCDQNYMQMLNHQINDKKLRRPLFIVLVFCCFKYFRPRPQYFDYFHMKLFDGFLFRDSVDWALKRPGERLKNKRFRRARITGWFRVDSERLIRLKIYGSIKTYPNSYRYAL